MKHAQPFSMTAARLALGFFLLSTMACTKELPPPAAPPPSLPAALADEPAGDGGLGRVIIDTDVPATVEREAGRVEIYERRHFPYRGAVAVRSFGSNHPVTGTEWEPICSSTPCTLTLRYGEHTLRFRALDDEHRHDTTTIRVSRRREVINHTLGRERTSPGTLVGGTMIAMSILALFIPFGTNMKLGTQESNIVFASSVAGAFGGLAVMSFFPNTTQPGATTQWSPGITF
jgi:hypothetical protein